MSDASFEIKSSADFFRALEDAVQDFRDDPTSSRKAVAAFMFAYHLREWIWKEHEAVVRDKKGCDTASDFNTFVNNAHLNFPVIRDICNGSKHFGRDPTSRVDTSGLSGGAFSRSFSSGFNIGRLTVTVNGSQLQAEHLLNDVVSHYRGLLQNLGLI